MNRPAQLILTITDRCNHRCQMCYYHSSLNRRTMVMSLTEYQKLSDELNDLDQLLISGGEPFLRQDIAEIMEIFYRNNRTRSVFIPSNGSTPDRIITAVRQMLDLMPDLKLTLMMSLEGLHEEHDKIHQRAGAFESVVETIRRLTMLRAYLQSQGKQWFLVLLNSVVTNENTEFIIPLMEYAKEHLYVDSHTFTPMRGSGPTPDCRPPTPAQFEALRKQAQPYFQHYLENQPTVLQSTLDRYALWMGLLRGEGLPFQCQAGHYIGVIEPDAKVRLCELTPVIGDLRETDFDFERVWNSVEANELRQQLIGCSCTHACFITASQKYYSLQTICA